MTNDDQQQPMLDGLVLETPTSGTLRNAIRITLDALKEEGLLEKRHTGVAQLALILADAVERGATSNKPYSAAQNAAQLLVALEQLPKPMEADVAQKFAELVDSLRGES